MNFDWYKSEEGREYWQVLQFSEQAVFGVV